MYRSFVDALKGGSVKQKVNSLCISVIKLFSDL